MTEKTSTRRRGRKLAGMLAGGLALSLLPFAAPASAQTTPLPAAQGTALACPVNDNGTPTDPTDDFSEVPRDVFTDVTTGATHALSIDCAAWYQITSGTSATTYNPGGTVKRDQMATFIAQVIDYVADRSTAVDGLDPAPAGNLFPCDLDTSNVHFANIQRLADAGIVAGTGENSEGEDCYDPGGNVSREQMATFIRQAQDVVGPVSDAAIADNYFVDDDSSIHEDNINAIAKEGIVRGTGPNANNEPTYTPGADVTRDQMATFLMTKVDRLIEDINALVPGDVEQPPYATVIAAPDPVAKGDPLTVTSTGFRGTISSITAEGCGADEETSAPLTPTVVTLTIPATQASGDCDITVVTSFTDIPEFGGEDRTDTDVIEVTVVP